MKTAISIPNDDFERFERLAARQGMNRSEFYRVAAQRFADELEGSSNLTDLANAAIERAGQPADPLFVEEAARIMGRETEW